MNTFYTVSRYTSPLLIAAVFVFSAHAQETNNPPPTEASPFRVDFSPVSQSPGGSESASANSTSSPTTAAGSRSVLQDSPNIPNPGATGQATNAMGAIAPENGAAQPVPSGPQQLQQTFTENPQREQTAPAEITQVSRTFDSLPNDAGQVWREYDISPYTTAVQGDPQPQQALLDWILSETGTEMWFHEPLGILSANRNRLFVYHTPEIHAVVKPIIDRFVKTRGQVQNIDINLVTVQNPNWRSRAYTMMQPIEVQSPGVEAWMISKENAAVLLGQLRQRGDFRQHSSGRLTAHDGQKVVLERREPVQFVRSLRWINGQIPNYQPMMTTVDEGYRLDISSLSSLDNRTIEAMIHCDVDQVEKLTTVKVPVPYLVGSAAEKMNLQIPQIVSWRLKERFRWPADQVLLLSCGVVANPDPKTGNELGGPLAGLTRVLGGRKRADALVFLEYRGPAIGAEMPAVTAQRGMRPVSPR